jgi:hypothetical protein
MTVLEPKWLRIVGAISITTFIIIIVVIDVCIVVVIVVAGVREI